MCATLTDCPKPSISRDPCSDTPPAFALMGVRVVLLLLLPWPLVRSCRCRRPRPSSGSRQSPAVEFTAALLAGLARRVHYSDSAGELQPKYHGSSHHGKYLKILLVSSVAQSPIRLAQVRFDAHTDCVELMSYYWLERSVPPLSMGEGQNHQVDHEIVLGRVFQGTVLIDSLHQSIEERHEVLVQGAGLGSARMITIIGFFYDSIKDQILGSLIQFLIINGEHTHRYLFDSGLDICLMLACLGSSVFVRHDQAFIRGC
ncbi:hypothetical protein F4778DRAFT_727253 [Xylariomycetidae sp. FL2044]|nr:hypothetical protein F4778DRAFT_727253 [Xylariomycetidae sp. FL2044]